MNQNIKPNFFIVGAPKCGTTAMSKYLNEHANVVISDPKEPHYFATDMNGMRTTEDEMEYRSYFKRVNSETIAIGESSVWYLYSEEAIRNIHNYNKSARLIVMLRNPVEMVYSMHSQHLYSTDENVKDFGRAWKYSNDRANLKYIPRNCRCPKNLIYTQIAKYHEQLTRLYRYFPEDQVHVILFEDFKRDARFEYRKVLSFLGLPDDARESFPIINENCVARNFVLKSLIANQPDFVVRVKNKLKIILNREHLGVTQFLNHVNTVYAARPPMDNAIRTEIIKVYQDDVERLSTLLNRSLTTWLQ